MIAIIDYKAGNIASVSNALTRLDAPHQVTHQVEELEAAEAIIFPGVGHAESAMRALQEHQLDKWLKLTTKPVLGICLGMQLFYESSEEGDSQGLGIIPGQLRKFDSSIYKVPHMGWNTIEQAREHPILDSISSVQHFYHVHSYYAPVNEFTVAKGHYITDFTAVVARDNYVGVQFHPEKSGRVGHLLLQNFLKMSQQLI
jgi:glutamine amidotransferase